MDRVSVVVVVESHKNSALFLGSSISLLSPTPQMSGTNLLVETQESGFNLRPLTERLIFRALSSWILIQRALVDDPSLIRLFRSAGFWFFRSNFPVLRIRVLLKWNLCPH